MKFLWVIFFSLLFASLSFAQITVEPINNQQNTSDQATVQLIQKMVLIETKLNSVPTTDQVNASLSALSNQTSNQMNNMLTQIIVISVLLNICQIGAFFGILFWLKSEGKI